MYIELFCVFFFWILIINKHSNYTFWWYCMLLAVVQLAVHTIRNRCLTVVSLIVPPALQLQMTLFQMYTFQLLHFLLLLLDHLLLPHMYMNKNYYYIENVTFKNMLFISKWWNIYYIQNCYHYFDVLCQKLEEPSISK